MSQVKIAVIDDDASMRQAVVGLVRSLGYAASGFGSSEAFLDEAAPSGYACIVSDVQLPGLSGLELKARLAVDGVTAPVILITARAEPALRERAMEQGALCMLRKPFPAEALIECIERALAQGAGPG